VLAPSGRFHVLFQLHFFFDHRVADGRRRKTDASLAVHEQNALKARPSGIRPQSDWVHRAVLGSSALPEDREAHAGGRPQPPFLFPESFYKQP
jgi:hypothetical protein